MVRPRGSNSKSCCFSERIARYCGNNFCNFLRIFTLASFKVERKVVPALLESPAHAEAEFGILPRLESWPSPYELTV